MIYSRCTLPWHSDHCLPSHLFIVLLLPVVIRLFTFYGGAVPLTVGVFDCSILLLNLVTQFAFTMPLFHSGAVLFNIIHTRHSVCD